MHSYDVKIRYIPGKDPAMVFLDADNKVVLEEDVAEKKKEEITQLLEKHGLLKSAEARSEVPEEPYEEEPEPDEPWEEEEDREDEEFEGHEGEEEATAGPETEEDDEEDAFEHTEL
ncbi:hypothetical protein OS493_015945 [Desmophyllum pertusum]|uniref:Selenoprotein F/M domain-containing protein n=1 Tax=Desmophyllum pertusum TaxID=174260 RepID=A0A9X0CF79_9CNID|nr:hypothetical protein OS493_015945 [Desmophyllum pertusum]